MMTVKTLDQLLNENIISQMTYDRVILSKQYIERKYNLKSKKNLELQNFLSQLNLYNIKQSQINSLRNEIFLNQKEKYRKSREKQSIRQYESLSIIGRGAFGEVHVCREKNTGNIYAIKKIKKQVLIEKNQLIHIRNEQYFMSNVKNEWIVDLKASFQEGDYLFLVMEYCPGGDLMNLLIEKDVLTEKEAKFYLAELILAIESIHKLDCIHRDIKPDNILIDSDGHIKLTDFGLAKISEKIFEQNSNKNNICTHIKNYSCVGTAFYVAPEVLKKTGYGPEIDWWSAGVIFYEMLVGYAPFCSKETKEACQKVMNWQKYLEIPKKIKMKMSDEAEDLIYKLISNKNKRLGKNGADEIKQHPFFSDINWDNIRNMKAPFIPYLENEYDTKYFQTFQKLEPFYPKIDIIHHKRKDIEYLGYTYKEENDDKDLSDIFENIKKSILEKSKIEQEKLTMNNTSLNNIKTEINLNSKKDLFELIKKNPSEKNTNIQNLSKNKIININSKRNKDNNVCNKEIKLNVIKLPNKKSNKNLINLDKMINMNTISLPAKNRTIIQQVNNINKPNKTIKRLSPKPNYYFILKLLNLSKDKSKKKAKSKNISKNNIVKRNNNLLESMLNNISKNSIKTNKTNPNIVKKRKMNNHIKIINIIQNSNYNNIVHHNTNNSNNRKKVIFKRSVKIPYNLTNES